MSSLINLIKAVLLNETSRTSHAALKPSSPADCATQPAAVAIVTQAIAPGRKGQVKFQGSWWTARCESEAVLLAGDMVQVLNRQNITLYVEPLPLLRLSLKQPALLPY